MMLISTATNVTADDTYVIQNHNKNENVIAWCYWLNIVNIYTNNNIIHGNDMIWYQGNRKWTTMMKVKQENVIGITRPMHILNKSDNEHITKTMEIKFVMMNIWWLKCVENKNTTANINSVSDVFINFIDCYMKRVRHIHIHAWMWVCETALFMNMHRWDLFIIHMHIYVE